MSSSLSSTLLIIGNPETVHVGAHLAAAAQELARPAAFLDSRDAFGGNGVFRRLNWELRGHRPNRLREFSERVVSACREHRPPRMLATGIAPISAGALVEIGRMGTTRLNYLTDDPWNPSHLAPWFMDALTEYDHVFSTRRSNLEDLRMHGCPHVSYVPFGYAPSLHYCNDPGRVQQERCCADIVFAGGADNDRLPLVTALIREQFDLALYGGYWDQHPETKRFARGLADPATLRNTISSAKVALCLVRRANRDGSAMRTFEVAAIGACMLAEYTHEHHEILGEDGEAVVYFRSTVEMIDRLRWLLSHDSERSRLADAVRTRITNGRNTYKDRLETMLGVAAPAFES